jgi:hypothetical protein
LAFFFDSAAVASATFIGFLATCIHTSFTFAGYHYGHDVDEAETVSRTALTGQTG